VFEKTFINQLIRLHNRYKEARHKLTGRKDSKPVKTMMTSMCFSNITETPFDSKISSVKPSPYLNDASISPIPFVKTPNEGKKETPNLLHEFNLPKTSTSRNHKSNRRLVFPTRDTAQPSTIHSTYHQEIPIVKTNADQKISPEHPFSSFFTINSEARQTTPASQWVGNNVYKTPS